MRKVEERGTGIFQSFGVVHELRRHLLGHLRSGLQHRAVLHTKMKCRLRSNPELRKNRNARANDCPDGLREFRSAIQLDHVGAAFFHNANGRPERAIHALLKGSERKVATDQGSLRSAADGFTYYDHLFQSDL